MRKQIVKESGATPPRVYLERSPKGVIVCGVETSARTLEQARIRAQKEFTRLLRYARRMDRVVGNDKGGE